MTLDFFPFIIGEFARFIDYLERDGHLADVVHEPGDAQGGKLGLCE
jgi:hypothetical protein